MPKADRKPPRWANKFFKWYCRQELVESIEGDLLERFHDHLKNEGLWIARIRYYWNVIKFMNKYTLRKPSPEKSSYSNSLFTLTHLLSTSVKYFRRHKFYTFLNILGLSLGLASILLIYFFINHELSFDKFHTQGDRVYRITNHYIFDNGGEFRLANSAPALAPELLEAIPEFEKVARLRYAMRTLIRQGDLSFYEDYGYYADSSFLEIMSFDMVSGNAENALDEPNSIVITEDLEEKYFGPDQALGNFLEVNGQLVEVTGVLKAIPKNSHLNFNFLLSFTTYEVPDGYASDLNSWSWAGFLTYGLVRLNPNIEMITGKVNRLIKEKIASRNVTIEAELQLLQHIYLGSSNLPDDLNSNLRSGSQFSLYALGVVSFLILLIACFNFMNLAVAISFHRIREMGIRKILGAQRRTVVAQLLSDSVLITLLALSLGFALVFLTSPFMMNQLDSDFELTVTLLIDHLPIIFTGTLFLALMSGSYPAFLLSKADANNALKGHNHGTAGKGLKYGLNTFQFFISITLLSSTIIVSQQLKHLRNQNLGLDQENVLMVRLLPEDMSRFYDLFKDQLIQQPGVLSMSRSERLVGDPWPNNGIRITGSSDAETKEVIGNLVGYDYLETLGIKIKQGRSFSEEFKTDSLNSIILNESAVKHLGLTDPIGTKLEFFSLNGPRTVIGVMEDFNFSSLHEAIGPVVLVMPFIDLEYAMIRIAPGMLPERLASIENTWRNVAPDIPLDMKFMDGHLNDLYESEKQLSMLISAFSALGILLACFGLYGLISFTINSRIKEIGIRKVLGANDFSILGLVSRQYLITVALGFLFALPIGFYLMTSWLETFAYRIDITFSYFIFSGVTLGLLSMFVIGKKVHATLKTNPALILRDE